MKNMQEKIQPDVHGIKEPFHVLVTCISKKVPLLQEVKRAAKRFSNDIRVFGGDMSADVIGTYFVDEFYLMKRVAEANIDEIIQYCEEKNIRLIIPTRDGELVFWAQHAEHLAANGIMVSISSPQTVDACIDKLKFSEICEEKKILAIPTYLQPNDLYAAWVVKERFGAGSDKLKLNVSAKEAVEFAQNLSHPIFQPFIKGTEYSVDSYVSRTGSVKGVVVRKRNLVVNGESQITEIERNEAFEKMFEEIVRKLNIRGASVLQALVNDDGIFIIECNSRFGGATTLSVHHGLDIFYWSILEAAGNDLEKYPFERIDGVKKQIRYNCDLIIG